MRAQRLLSLLLVLQARRERVTAKALSRRLQVSERTIYRDLDALGAAGVPVYGQTGPGGGVALAGDWRTSLTGLTSNEAEALAAVGVPAALQGIGLSESLRTSLVKLVASLPAVQAQAAEHARERLHIDPTSFFEVPERVPHLGVLREAVWQNRRVRLRYRDFDGRMSDRTVDPLALVVKADRFYLVAGTARGPTVFRGARVESARLLAATFERPAGFDLRAFWEEWCQAFARERPRYLVTLRLTAEGEEGLRRERPSYDAARLAEGRLDPNGRKVATLDFERRSIAASQILALGGDVEVVEPAELRDQLRRLGRALVALYRAPARI